MDNSAANTDSLHSDYWRAHRDLLFKACCMALIVTAMSFAIRGNIVEALGKQFKLGEGQMGWVNGAAMLGFGLSIAIGGWLCDVVGMGRLLILAVVGHAIGILTTVLTGASVAFPMLFLGTLAFGMANGFVEAACNPLIATLYPDEKIRRLNLFHVWFPGGIVIGGVVAWFISSNNIGGEHNWQIQMLTMVLPLVIYGSMFIGKKFPATERSASGVSTSEMYKACLNPMYILLLICMTMTAATELVTENWMPSILSFTLHQPGVLFVVLVAALMAIGRNFAGNIVHKMSPIALLIWSSLFGIAGIGLLAKANSSTSGIVAAVIFAVGVCYYWPTMLGITSERFPKTGALGIGLMGSIGSFSVSLWTPLVGRMYQKGIDVAVAAGQTQDAAHAAGGRDGLGVLLYLPIILTVVFTGIYLRDKSRGGYQKEVLVQHQEEDAETPAVAAT